MWTNCGRKCTRTCRKPTISCGFQVCQAVPMSSLRTLPARQQLPHSDEVQEASTLAIDPSHTSLSVQDDRPFRSMTTRPMDVWIAASYTVERPRDRLLL